MRNAISWFEIPTRDFNRAVKFYNQIFGVKLQLTLVMGMDMAIFPHDEDGVGGALTADSPDTAPGDRGPTIYLNAGNQLNQVLERVEIAGGKIILPRTFIGEDSGYFALITDTEGNRIGLHGMA